MVQFGNHLNLVQTQTRPKVQVHVQGSCEPEPLIEVWVWAETGPEPLGSGEVWAKANVKKKVYTD